MERFEGSVLQERDRGRWGGESGGVGGMSICWRWGFGELKFG